MHVPCSQSFIFSVYEKNGNFQDKTLVILPAPFFLFQGLGGWKFKSSARVTHKFIAKADSKTQQKFLSCIFEMAAAQKDSLLFIK